LICEYNMDFVNQILEEMEAVELARRNDEEGNFTPGPSGSSAQAALVAKTAK